MKIPLPQRQRGMARTRMARTGPLYRPAALRVLIGLAVVALLANLGFAWLYSQASGEVLAPRQEQSDGMILATPIDERHVLVATLSNELVLLEDGNPLHRTSLPNLIGGIAVAEDGSTIYAGTSDGKLTLFDATLQPQGEIPIGRRIVGVRAPEQGGVLVANGIGAFSDRYYIAHYPGTDPKPAWTKRVEFTITDLQTRDDIAYYGTANSRVGAIDGAGEQLWVVTLRRPISRLLPLEEGGVLVGDDKGFLTLLDNGGKVVWETTLSQYPIRALYFDTPTSMYFAGDRQGSLYGVDTTGALRITEKATTSDLESLLPMADGSALVVPRQGQWLTLDPTAISGSEAGTRLLWGWIGFDAIALLALFAAAVLAVEPWRAAVPRLAWRVRRGYVSYLFLLPSLVLILAVFYYPAAMAAYYSMTTFSLRRATEFIGFENYREILFDDFYFRVGFWNMVLILVTSLFKSVGPPLLVAELIFWLRKESHRYIFRTLFVLPAVVPGLVGTLLWRQVYDPIGGLLNQLLGGVGLDYLKTAWLGNEDTALWAIIAAGFPWIGAFPFLVYLGGLLNINSELYDAAKIDGAGWWARFWRIDMPLLAPQHGLILFFTFLGSIQGFATILIYTRGGPGYATYVPGLQMFLKISEGDFGYASAIGMILFALVMMGTALRFLRRSPQV